MTTTTFDRHLARDSAETLWATRVRLSALPVPAGRGWHPLQAAMSDVLADLPTGIAGVIAKQVTIQALLDRLPPTPARNRVAAFNQLYLTITRRVDAALQAGVHWPEFLELLDVEFARRYFLALDLWNRDEEDTPDAWEVLFKRADDLEMTKLVAAVLGVNAHINHDLSLALVDTWQQLGPPPDDTIYPDYLLVNRIFYEEIPLLRRCFSDEWQMDIDRMVGPLDDWSQRVVVQVTRARAWAQALRLWPLRDRPEDFEQARRIMDRAAALLGEWLIFGDRVVTDTGDVTLGGWRFLRGLVGASDRAIPRQRTDEAPSVSPR